MSYKEGREETFKRSFTQEDFDRFADLTGDNNPIHVDPEFSARTHFGKTVAHGMLLDSTICRVLSTQYPGPGVLQIKQEMMFQNPTYTDTEITVKFYVTETCGVCETIAPQCGRQSPQESSTRGAFIIDNKLSKMAPLSSQQPAI